MVSKKHKGLAAMALVTLMAMLSLGLMSIPAIEAAGPTTVVVYPGNQHGWFFLNDQTDDPITATGEFVSGPATPPLGTGSVELNTTGPSDGQVIKLPVQYQGVKLADITTLKYSTYQASSNVNTATAIALQFDVDKDATDTDTSYQGRVIFEPYNNNGGTVPLGVWTEWNALSGNWWLSKSGTKFSNNCPQSSPCTLTQLLSLYPNIWISESVIFKAGSGWTTPFSGNVDAFTIGVNGSNTTYDFELNPPYVVAVNKDQCKNGGWQILKRADGSPFKNQGDCVSYTNNGK